MNGAESLVRTLLANQVNTCFANPGTSEMHFVAALDRIPGMRCVLGLQENVVTGMADGYWRMLDRPAATLLHCGPGLANGLGNLHNARIARSGIVNVVGDQATYHRPYDPPLAADTEGWARPVSAWVRTSSTAACVGADAAAAVQAARSAPGWIATLVLPADTAWNEGGITADPLPVPDPPTPDPHVVRAAARVLREESGVLLLLGGRALRAGALLAAHRLRAATGCRLLGESFNARVERGQGRVGVERVPYNVDLAVEALRDVRHLILVQAAAPVGFFAYPGKPSLHYPEDAQVHVLARPEQDALAALEALCDVLGAPAVPPPDPGARPEVGRGAPSPEGLARTVGALLPENAVVVDEIISYSYGPGRGFFGETHAAAPHDWLQITGGAIGCGPPLATGAAIAVPGRRVVNLQADGSAMYTLQALWTQARERLPVTTVVLANQKYAILLGEYRNVGANPGRTALDMMDLGNPGLNWVSLARGMGVEGARAGTLEQLADLLAQSFVQDGPFVIELAI
jgi:acetolactate synthase-1/2/3 large subunit